MSELDLEWRAQATRNLEVQSDRRLFEFYDGEDLTDWQERKIRIQLYNLARNFKEKNADYAKSLERFIQVWEDPANKLDGNTNIEAVNALIGAAGLEAAREWPLQNFFMNLEASLRRIISSENKLPRMPMGNDKPPAGLTAKKPLGVAVPSMFGPEKEAPTPGGAPAPLPKPGEEEPVPKL